MKRSPVTVIKTLLIIWIFPSLAYTQDFTLQTDNAGIFGPFKTNGVAVADYDLDGDLDIYLAAGMQYKPDQPSTWNRLFKNNGDGTFSDATDEAGLRITLSGYDYGGMGNKFGVAWGDYDNDGDPDILLTHLGPELLFRNEGNGTFTDVTQTAGIAGNDNDHTSSAVWWDFDLDGDLDLYISAWFGLNRMYENLGNDTFADISTQTALADSGRTWTSLPFDANTDGLPDLYVVNDFGENRFYLNRGNHIFEEATAQFGLKDPGHGMGVTLGDYNNDGNFDIYLTNIADIYPNPLFTNTGQGNFTENAAAMQIDSAGWAWGTEFFDCDHDGDLDLYVSNGFLVGHGNNFFYINRMESGTIIFEDASVQSHTNGAGDARGVVIFDYDNDGDLDIIVANWGVKPYLYQNNTLGKNWIKIGLEGTVSNRDAIGATVSLKSDGKWQYRYNDGVGFLGQSIQPIHFGIDAAQEIEEINVLWPSGISETFYNISANQTLKIREGEGLVTAIQTGSENSPLTAFVVNENYPNPFNGSTIIEFFLPAPSSIRFEVFNILGEKIFTQTQTFSTGGKKHFTWNATTTDQHPLPSGIYLYTIKFRDAFHFGKMLYAR